MEEIIESSGNIFKDLGLTNPEKNYMTEEFHCDGSVDLVVDDIEQFFFVYGYNYALGSIWKSRRLDPITNKWKWIYEGYVQLKHHLVKFEGRNKKNAYKALKILVKQIDQNRDDKHKKYCEFLRKQRENKEQNEDTKNS